MTSYRACPTSRARRTKADVAAIRVAISEVIEDDPPMTVRQVFTKRISLALSGKLVSDGSAFVMACGTAERVKIADIGEFAALIESCPCSRPSHSERYVPVCPTS